MPSLKQKIPYWIKLAKLNIIWNFRQATCSIRILPHFIIIGAQKSGTSSLFYYLSQHPQLIPSYRKEVHFFDGGLVPNIDTFKKGEAWYRAHFPVQKRTNNNRKAFEATPLYVFNPLAPQRIFELIPEVKLIVLLRNPVERAVSHYFHESRKGRESLPIMEALQIEEERLRPVINNNDYKSNLFMHHSYKSRGLYFEQLERYFNIFPKNNILVINSETFFAQTDDTLRRVFTFVGVDSEFKVNDLKPLNVGKNRIELFPGVYEYLEDYFRVHNQNLYKLLGENYAW